MGHEEVERLEAGHSLQGADVAEVLGRMKTRIEPPIPETNLMSGYQPA